MPRRYGLQSAAGPRISAARHARAPHHDVLHTPVRKPFQPPVTSHDFGFETWDDFVPWSALAPTMPFKALRIVLVTVAVVAAAVVAGLHWAIPSALAAVGVAALWKQRRSRHRAASEIVATVLEDLHRSHEVGDVRYQLERALELDPDHDGARFLLACTLLEERRHLSALLQLAPLRDHHPDIGEVVLIAAAAYVNLSLHEDALRMLGVLEIEPEHPSLPAAAAMYHHCCTTLGRPVEDAGGLETTSSQAFS